MATLRDGRFVTLGPLGEGTQGKTFDGVDKREGRPVAIKQFDVRGAKAWKDVELAEREARVLRELSHPRLPAYVDHFEEDGTLWLVMEKIEGESLASIRKRGAVLGEADVLRLLSDAAEVLAYLHGRAPAVIHRDLKPGNVIRRPDGSFAFVDFGAVRDKLRPEGGSTVVGTFGFMAPEQFQGRALPASDVYAIGATALTMLTGIEPEQLPHKGLGIDVRAALRGRASETLVDVLEQMLEIDPDKRASSIAKLLESRKPPRQERRPKWEDDLGEQIEEGARAFERQVKEAARKWERDAHRFHDESRERKRAERERRREERHARRQRRGLPWPIAVLFIVGLALAIPAVVLALKVIVPAIFFVLSLFLGRKLFVVPTAAVRAASDRAVEAMRNAQNRLQKSFVPPREEELPRVRVAPGEPAPKVRVEHHDHDPVAEAEREAEELLEADERKSKKRRG